MLRTTQEAREYFQPLKYKDITKEDFNNLICILKRHLQKRNEIELKHESENKNGVRDYIFDIRKKDCKFYSKKNGLLSSAFIKVLCDNYSVREGISFNSDGFIGFAGWASSYNIRPFLDAFEEWVMMLKAFHTPIFKSYEYLGQFKKLPSKAEVGSIVTVNNSTYIYLDGWQKQETSEEYLISQIRGILYKSKDSKLKREITEILNKWEVIE